MNRPFPDDELPNQLSSVDNRYTQEVRHCNNLWRSNYHEAAIYIEEGLNNDKFENHPRKRATLNSAPAQVIPSQTHDYDAADQSPKESNQIDADLAIKLDKSKPKLKAPPDGSQYTTIETYILVHNRYFYQLDLAASIVLLFLALFEPPAIEGYELNSDTHAAIEMFALGIIAIELLLKFRWMGPKRFFQHGRTVIKLVVLLTMNIETIVILLRRSTHPRYTRALRPIFLIDNHYCHGIRRAIRQIFQSLPPILDMFTLALFFMFVFSIFGFYLFNSSNHYFSDMPTTVGNLLVLATTASLPDIMMPSYAVTRWSTIYFVLFVIIHLFLLTNLTLAAVYESFTRKEKEKFHKLLLHRRKACQKAFSLLVSRREPNRIHYRQFMGLMRYLNRKCSMFDAYLIFKALDTDKNGSISLEEFYQIYDYINLDWELIYPENHWYDDYSWLPESLRYCLDVMDRTVRHRYFEWIVDLLITIAAVLQFSEAVTVNSRETNSQMNPSAATLGPTPYRPDSVSTLIFVVIFTFELVLRLVSAGLKDYWKNRWNRFDLLVVSISIFGLIAGRYKIYPFGWVVVLRVLRLTRLFEFKRRYKDMWQTLTYILLKRFVSMTCVVMILYYFFAIIGMEILGDYDLRNCCKNTSIESQFKYDTNSTSEYARYYLNDFGDIVASYLTLFSMSSTTYWSTTMTAYAIVSGTDWVRLFFGLFYLCSLIVMNIVIAFILESFLFRIHYRSKMGNNCDDTNLFTVRVALSSSEVDFLRKNLSRNHSFVGEKDGAYVMSDLATVSKDKNMTKLAKILARKQLIATSESVDGDFEAAIGERVALLTGQKRLADKRSRSGQKLTSAPSERSDKSGADNEDAMSSTSTNRRPQSKSVRGEPLLGPEKRWYLIYQAEQIRNKFSFTMKMYADEVEGWLAEAERADRDEICMMISRNQVRAEHVAMARLARRGLTEQTGDLDWPRPRSYSTNFS